MFSSVSLLAFVSISVVPLGVLAGTEPVYVKKDVNFDDYPFVAPGPDDVRSPCPGLNTFVFSFTLKT